LRTYENQNLDFLDGLWTTVNISSIMTGCIYSVILNGNRQKPPLGTKPGQMVCFTFKNKCRQTCFTKRELRIERSAFSTSCCSLRESIS